MLIPKISEPTPLTRFRPVNLISSAYKILAKVLDRRLKTIINFVVGENQFFFIKGRQILDSTLIENELINSLKKNKECSLLFKVDFEKAFGSIDWSYLNYTMQLIGFSSKWKGWIQ